MIEFLRRLRRRLGRSKGHLRLGLSLADFFDQLEKREVSYVVLDTIDQSTSEGGGALRILIRDEHVERLDGLLTAWPYGCPVQLYTASGGKEFGFRPQSSSGRSNVPPVPILPTAVAQELLERAEKGTDGRYQLSAQDHFFVQAYLAVYLNEAVIPNAERRIAPSHPSREMPETLAGPGSGGGVAQAAPPTRIELEQVIADRGWRPSPEMLERLAVCDSWIRSTLLPKLASVGEGTGPPGLTVFFIRAETERRGLRDIVRSAAESEGFEILADAELSGAVAERVAETVRGGNWRRGPWPVSSGPPVRALFLFDVFPLPPPDEVIRQHPQLENARTYDAKMLARIRVQQRVGPMEMFNPVHSTDSSAQAWREAAAILPARDLARLRHVAELRLSAHPSPGQQIAELDSYSRHARSERIQYGGQAAIRRTFRYQYRHMLNREAEVLRCFSDRFPEVPRLLSQGTDYLVIEDVTRGHAPVASPDGRVLRRLSLQQIFRLREILTAMLQEGCDPVGWAPARNLLVSASGHSIKLVGFESAQWRSPPVPLEDAYCLRGVPADRNAHPDLTVEANSDPYPSLWRPYLMVDRETFIHARI